MARAAAVAVVALFAAIAGSACVDGTTPDCSDAGSQCGPDYDAYPVDDSGAEASVGDSSTDARADAPQPDSGSGSDSAIDAPTEAAKD